MTAFINLAGRRFGKLTAEQRVPGTKPIRWHCRCECGTEVVVSGGHLRTDHTASCGCAAHPRCLDRHHGDCNAPEYFVWLSMRARCGNPKHAGHANYGGRGIRVSERWQNSYPQFLEDMGRRPSPRHQLDRIDNDGPYSPENCRWATPAIQNRNRRNNRVITHAGKTQTAAEWADELGIPRGTFATRIKLGWGTERLMEPGDHRRSKRG